MQGRARGPQRRGGSHPGARRTKGGLYPQAVEQAGCFDISTQWYSTVVSDGRAACSAFIRWKDVVKGGIKERFWQLRKMGVRTVMITGDNPQTAAAIRCRAGVDDFMPRPKPETNWRASARSRRRQTHPR